MTQKFQRPSGSFNGQVGLTNRTKYIDDANATPKRAISSSKIDGDFNYLIDAVNQLDDASGTRTSIAERLDVSLNSDGTLKVSVAGALDEWIIQDNPGTITRIDNSTFTLAGGDFTGLYRVNRRIQVTVGGVALVGDIANSSFSGGVTTVSVVDLTDPVGSLSIIGSAPTKVAYGPLTPGARGNTPRRTDELDFTVGVNTITLNNDVGDLAFRRNGSIVARVGAGGLSGLAANSVNMASLVSMVAEALSPIGSIVAYAGSTAPNGWLLCHGQWISRTTYADLFALLGTTFGGGDGSTTFSMPDLRGRTIFGLDNMGGAAANRVTNAISAIAGTTRGAVGGSQSMQSHTHSLTDSGHSHGLGVPQAGAAYSGWAVNAGWSNASIGAKQATSTYHVDSATTGITLANTGSGTAQNMPPTIMLNWIMKV